MRIVLVSLAALLLAACAADADADGREFPPDLACDDVQACLADPTDGVVPCVGKIPENPSDYDGALWACFEGCLHTSDPDGYEVTTRADFEGFLVACFGDAVDGGHPLDAVWSETFLDELEVCLVGAKATQQLTLDVCYE